MKGGFRMDIESVYNEYFNDVYLYVKSLARDGHAAEEITQETFFKAMKSLKNFDGSKDIRAWLFTIAKNALSDHFVTIIVTLAVLTSLFVALYHPVIFQRGDPIPYLKAAVTLAGGAPYAKVNVPGTSAVYITKRGICDELISYIEESKGVPFVEQAGSAFLFSDGKYSLAVITEIYLSRFTVWTVPENTRERIPES